MVQRKTRFNSSKFNLEHDIVSANESWIYSYEPETKQKSTV